MKLWLKVVMMSVALLLHGSIAMAKYEEPDYKLIKKTKNIEVRWYAPTLIAQVAVQGSRDAAISSGFRKLADFIFGNNKSSTQKGASEKISMTTPVIQQANEKIAMTTPVVQQGNANQWTVHFVMPKKYTLKTLPKPNNKDISIQTTKPYKAIVIRFSGLSSQRNLRKHLSKLDDYIKNNGIKTLGQPIYAFYNPPWTLPFLRRNEIMYKLK